MHTGASLSTREDKKPQMILDYNSTKGEVDNLDKVGAAYSCQRKTARWLLVIFNHTVDVPMSHGLKSPRSGMPANFYLRQLFLEELGKAHVKIQASLILSSFGSKVKLRSPKQRPVDTGEKKGKRCQVCPSREDSKTSSSWLKSKNHICSPTVTFWPSCGEKWKCWTLNKRVYWNSYKI